MNDTKLTLKNCLTDKGLCKKFKKLYKSAFPKEERAPFFMLKSRAKRMLGEMLCVEDNGEFVGLVYILSDKKIAYIFYLAIDENLRGNGYGSKTLSAIKERYQNQKIFLARERLDEPCDNLEQRKSRREFYIKNGFKDLPLWIQEATVTYDVMSVGGYIEPEDYNLLIKNWCGKFFSKMVRMEIIKK